jgi:hypothetical protein
MPKKNLIKASDFNLKIKLNHQEYLKIYQINNKLLILIIKTLPKDFKKHLCMDWVYIIIYLSK